MVREARSAATLHTGAAASDQGEDAVDLQAQPPDERIDAAARELKDAVASDLLERIGRGSPIFFEQLVLDLLHKLGYGSDEEALEHVGSPGDGGIDGIISLDRLGFEKVYVQAKRWQGSVGRPHVQAFAGALTGRHATKGVMLTTSSFTSEARDFAASLPALVLIDGPRLASLMIDYAVGVTHYREVKLPRVDSDYFLDEE
jgi:restriction system protein